jgi:putative transposase
VSLRLRTWDLSELYLVAPKSGEILCRLLPVDKRRNADGQRAAKTAPSGTAAEPAPGGMAPLLSKLIAEYAATGLPPAYLPKDEILP